MTESNPWLITSFYRFLPITDPQQNAKLWAEKAQSLDIQGLLILGREGFNITCAARSQESLSAFKTWAIEAFQCPELSFKDSSSEAAPFVRFKVKVRDEIVTLGTPDLVPQDHSHRHLSPAEWNRVLKEETDIVVLDTRNSYETRIGTFKGAVDPKIEQFTEFPEFVEKQGYDKDQKMLIFCTGGIRCEKGLLELERRGFNNVYQLDGGILNYLEQFPNDQFDGECFVFDHRVAVDQNLQPSQVYKLCPHCGQPADQPITCVRCDSEALVCHQCLNQTGFQHVCSKNCAYHHRLNPRRKGLPQVLDRNTKPSLAR